MGTRISRRNFLTGIGLAHAAARVGMSQSPKSDDRMVRAAIHPGIGVARVGNSSEEYFIGPELPYAAPATGTTYKDAAGALKRQAARFRVYGYNADGQVVKELTADDARIRWTVHVANKKAAWYRFEVALDIPAAVPCSRRNPNFTGEHRRLLTIDPGPRSIEGRNQSGSDSRFDTGKFVNTPVYLGELRTDDRGHLIFLAGKGVSDTIFGNRTATTFANNDLWYDDIADGPVSAEVTLATEETIPVDPAWVVTAPPNYAPDLVSVQTLYDVMVDAFQGPNAQDLGRPSFTRHVYPILRQFSDAQWVNKGFYLRFGWGARYDFLQPAYVGRLAGNRPEDAVARNEVFGNFRDPDFASVQVGAWPEMYGDNAGIPSSDPRQFMAVTKTQYEYLRRWAAGDFDPDWNPNAPPLPASIEDVPPADRPALLDQAALYFCAGGPFHPGCEMTWPMRHASMYSEPFRIRERAADVAEPDYGDQLTPAAALAERGPLYANGPGDITRWMAVPWQTDTASCRSGYDPNYDPYLPTFWPARVPNHVLAQDQYERVMNPALSDAERNDAFNTRATWYRWLNGEYLQQINEMISVFPRLGIVERREGPKDRQDLPQVMYVESAPGFTGEAPSDRNTVVGFSAKIAPTGGR